MVYRIDKSRSEESSLFHVSRVRLRQSSLHHNVAASSFGTFTGVKIISLTLVADISLLHLRQLLTNIGVAASVLEIMAIVSIYKLHLPVILISTLRLSHLEIHF